MCRLCLGACGLPDNSASNKRTRGIHVRFGLYDLPPSNMLDNLISYPAIEWNDVPQGPKRLVFQQIILFKIDNIKEELNLHF